MGCLGLAAAYRVIFLCYHQLQQFQMYLVVDISILGVSETRSDLSLILFQQ